MRRTFSTAHRKVQRPFTFVKFESATETSAMAKHISWVMSAAALLLITTLLSAHTMRASLTTGELSLRCAGQAKVSTCSDASGNFGGIIWLASWMTCMQRIIASRRLLLECALAAAQHHESRASARLWPVGSLRASLKRSLCAKFGTCLLLMASAGRRRVQP